MADPFLDENGVPWDPETAAQHATLVQGGYSTPDIEAHRMLADGGVAAERARAWQVRKAEEIHAGHMRARAGLPGVWPVERTHEDDHHG